MAADAGCRAYVALVFCVHTIFQEITLFNINISVYYDNPEDWNNSIYVHKPQLRLWLMISQFLIKKFQGL